VHFADTVVNVFLMVLKNKVW